MDSPSSLAALFLSSFLAATMLPGGSEVAFLAFLHTFPSDAVPALLAGTTGNTLGGFSSYWIGRLIPERKQLKYIGLLQRWGSPALLLSWLPVIGDPLCVAAGWLRMNAGLALLFIALGKCARYAVLWATWQAL